MTKYFEEDRGKKPDSELSDYQKEIESTENVILCVAKAERMVWEIGKSLISEETETNERSKFVENRRTSPP